MSIENYSVATHRRLRGPRAGRVGLGRGRSGAHRRVRAMHGRQAVDSRRRGACEAREPLRRHDRAWLSDAVAAGGDSRSRSASIPEDASAGLNYGLDKVRFMTPVKAGARVRNRVTLVSVETKGGGRIIVKTMNELQIEGEDKPALIAETLAMLVA